MKKKVVFFGNLSKIVCLTNTGINAVLYYSTGLFIGAGLATESAKYATIGQ